ENMRLADDVHQTENGDHREPEQHHRSEHGPDPRGTESLKEEKRNEHDDRDRYDVWSEDRRGHFQPFDGTEHGDGGRDHSVAVQQSGSEKTEADEHRAAATGPDQRHQGQDSALAAIVGAHHQHEVFDRDDDDERPEDQREDAQDVLRRWDHGVMSAEAFAQGVERAGADVAVHHAEGAEGE